MFEWRLEKQKHNHCLYLLCDGYNILMEKLVHFQQWFCIIKVNIFYHRQLTCVLPVSVCMLVGWSVRVTDSRVLTWQKIWGKKNKKHNLVGGLGLELLMDQIIVHVCQYDLDAHKEGFGPGRISEDSAPLPLVKLPWRHMELRSETVTSVWVIALCGQSRFGPGEKEEETLPSHFLPSVPLLTQCLSHLMREI